MEVWQNELLYFRMHQCTTRESIPGLEAFLRLYRETEANVDPSAPKAGTWRYTIFQLMDVPESSRAAKCLSMLSMLLVAFSVATVCVETLKECATSQECVRFLGARTCACAQCVVGQSPPQLISDDKAIVTFDEDFRDDGAVSDIAIAAADSDLVIVSIFSSEYILRLLVAARKLKFMVDFLNIIDLLSILPTWLALLASDSAEIQAAADALRVVRILRVFKLARHNTGLQVRLARSVRETGTV